MDSDTAERPERRDIDDAVTYAPTGGTLQEPPTAVPGHHCIDERVAIGRGDRRFEQAVAAVLDWQVQRGAGVRVDVDGPPRPGRRVTLRVGVGPARLSAPVVVVGVVTAEAGGGPAHRAAARPTDTEPGAPGTVVRRAGFAYGTAPGHPESGEEAFLVEQDGAGVVWLRIIAFSRPATWYARLGGPAARAVQAIITRRYLRALGPRMTS